MSLEDYAEDKPIETQYQVIITCVYLKTMQYIFPYKIKFDRSLGIIHPPLYLLWLLEQIINYTAAREAPMNLSYAEMKLRIILYI